MKKHPFLLLLSCLAVSSASAGIYQFDLQGIGGMGLLPSNETGSSVSSATGGEIGAGITFDDSTNILTVNVGWGSGNGFADLTGTATAAHFHGPGDMNTATGVALALSTQPGSILWDSDPASGSITGWVDLDTVSLGNGATIADLMNGLWYLNVHTTANPGGEIRGNLVAVPEPASAPLLLGMLTATLLFATRRRRRA